MSDSTEAPDRGGPLRWLRQVLPWGSGRVVTVAAWEASRPMTVLLGVVVVALGALPVAQMILVSEVVGRLPAGVREVRQGGSAGAVFAGLAILAAIYLLAQCVPLVQWSVGRLLGARMDVGARRSLLTLAAERPGLSHLEQQTVADAMTAARETRTASYGPDDAVRGLAGLVAGRIHGFAAAGILATFRWWAPLVLIVTFMPWDRYFRSQHHKLVEGLLSHTADQGRAKYFRDLGTDASAGKEIRIFGLGGFVQRGFRNHFLAGMAAVWKSRDTNLAIFLPCVLSVVAGYAVVFGTVGYELATGPQTLTATTLYVLVAGNVWRIVPSYNDLSRLTIGSAGLMAARRAIASVAPVAPVAKPAGIPFPPAGRIRFENVAFSYRSPVDGNSVEVFRDLNLTIVPRQSLGIVGDNGAGKTTLVKLLCGLYAPTAGRITVDGTDLATVDLDAWRRNLTAIFQDYVRYPLTVRDNVALGAGGELGDEQLRAVLAEAEATAVVDRLAHGAETVLGRDLPGGVELSGGQWQKVAVARALAGLRAGASVLVLDEPTAHLDVRTEAKLFERILTLVPGLTTLLISHRFANVRRADRIVVLTGGRVTEDGSHDDLMRAGGRYAEMFRVQAAHFDSAVAGAGQGGEN